MFEPDGTENQLKNEQGNPEQQAVCDTELQVKTPMIEKQGTDNGL
jgi:hypothetical protein